MEKLVPLCKRRGIVFPSSEIYGGIGSFWDFGPLGVELKNNVKMAWWQKVVRERDDVVGADTSIIMAAPVWKASGHVDSFADPLADCKRCRQRFRADHVQGGSCPECGGELTEARMFNLMFRTYIGPVEEKAAEVYLRPETAQGIFVDFKTIANASRHKLPFGIAQVGKSFRNEVSPGNFIFRSREFEQMELEYFVEVGTEQKWFEHWVNDRFQWYVDLGVNPAKLRKRRHSREELAHYARQCIDIEYEFPFGWQEIEGIADRGQFDLTQHMEHSREDLTWYDETTGERFVPAVVEASAGVDRSMLTFLVDAYAEEEDRVVLRLHPHLAPVKVGVFPLMRKPELVECAKRVEKMLRPCFATSYDDAGSIGRRYRRQDEIGTPCCVTIDYVTLEDGTVTIRDRDTMQQERVRIVDLKMALAERLQLPWFTS